MEKISCVICTECHRSFGRIADLRKHVKTFHIGKLEEIAPLSKEQLPFCCEHCGKTFKHQRSLHMHLKTHGVDTETVQKSLKRKCPLCEYGATFRKDFYVHFKTVHDINIEEEEVVINMEDLNKWKGDFEKKTNSKFVLERGSSGKTVRYQCHRSGFFQSRSRGIRHIKTQGPNKIDGFCPASIQTVEKEGKITIHVVKTHIGHQLDIGHLSLTTSERQRLAARIASKIPFNAILDEIRDSLTCEPMERVHLLTRKDLHNIESSFDLHSTAVRHKNDAVSIESWVNEMKDTCVLLYKPQGVVLEEFSQLKKEDFMLVIMNDGQKTVYEKFSDKCVCVDGTHGLNSYNFELHTLLVLDDLHQGFPCAFCISNRSDVEVMSLFFSCIKEKSGCTNTNVFMSDIAEAYFNAWMRVMEPPNFRLYCTWHVDRAWRKNLLSINSKEKQVLVYKWLRTLLQETDRSAFDKMLPQFLSETICDPDTNAFAMYFQQNYASKASSWAYCHRLHCKINTNMHIERMHRTIKYIYCSGKNVKRLDKAISAITKFVRDKLFDRLIVLNKGKISSKLQELRKRHKSSLELQKSSIMPIDDHWEIPSSSKAFETYTIFENNIHCECQLVCTDCNTCIHKYSCSCLDSAVRWNMCKHTHLLCQWKKEKQCSLAENSNEGNDALTIDVDSPSIESETILENIRKSNLNACKATLQEKKKMMLDNFTSILNRVDTEEELEGIQRLMNPIEPTLDAMQASTHVFEQVDKPRTKIDPQRRLFSTRKKTNRRKSHLIKPNDEERNAYAINLLSLEYEHK